MDAWTTEQTLRAAFAKEQPETNEHQLAPDPFVIVPCVNRFHRRVNDLLVPDPSCKVCLGLGIVRVLREHVPVVHRRGSDWERGDDAISRLADIAGPPS